MRIELRVVVAVIGLACLFPAVGLGQPPKSDPKTPATPPAKPQLTVQVFKLERGDPDAVITGLHSLLEAQDVEVPPPMPPAGAPMPMNPFSGLGGSITFGGFGVTTVPVWRATVDERTKAVIVRGSAKHLKVAADLVALLDRPANAPLPKLQVVKAFSLKHADAEGLVQVIETLAFDDVKLASPDEKLLVVIGPDESTTVIAALVKELDVPGKPEKKEETKKE
jgi:hypothetical protein